MKAKKLKTLMLSIHSKIHTIKKVVYLSYLVIWLLRVQLSKLVVLILQLRHSLVKRFALIHMMKQLKPLIIIQ
ncbi:Uncharacterised protein [Mycobacteroides abscessus]|nr:Uncharacterised protein [Mycobacteroides abscessus]